MEPPRNNTSDIIRLCHHGASASELGSPWEGSAKEARHEKMERNPCFYCSRLTSAEAAVLAAYAIVFWTHGPLYAHTSTVCGQQSMQKQQQGQHAQGQPFVQVGSVPDQ